MKTLFGAIVVSLSILTLSGNALAADKGTAEEATAMVKKAAALIKSDGKDKAFAAFADRNNPAFHDRDLYIFVYDLNGVALSNGNNPKMVGKSLIDMKDNEDKPLIKEMVDLAKGKGKGWVEYKWPNPITKAIESKASYVERVDDMLVGSGIYK